MEPTAKKKRMSGKRIPRKFRKFLGNQFVERRKKNPPPEEAEAGSSKRLSSTERKLKEAAVKISVDENWSGNRILDLDLLFSHLRENCRCDQCGGSLDFSEENIGGLAFRINQKCTSEKCGKKSVCESSEKIGAKKNVAEINRRAVVAIRSLGLGSKCLEKFCSHMELPEPPKGPTFYANLVNIHSSVQELATDSMKQAAKEEMELTGGMNVEVSGDGTWHSRGYTSADGVCTLAGIKTGKIIDVEVLSKNCMACAQYRGDRESDEYEEWYLSHVPECQANHLGSSSKMESDGMTAIYQRSVQERGLRYTTFVGDGDCATFKHLQDANPYPGFPLQKKECIGHIQKRMGKQLRDLKSSLKSQKLADGKTIGGQGRLTKQAIDKIQTFYGKAIRENCESVEDMKKAVMAIYHHMRSQENDFNHSFCPQGKESWCPYNRALANGEAYQHPKPVVAPACLDAAKPVFQTLSNTELLQRCLGAYNQNPNESFHSVIWKYASKTTTCGRRVIEISTYTAVLDFNDGQKAKLQLFRDLGLRVGKKLEEWVEKTDAERLEGAAKKVQASSLESRRQKRRAAAAEQERLLEEEGLYYDPGGF